jgi:hypothetical protein
MGTGTPFADLRERNETKNLGICGLYKKKVCLSTSAVYTQPNARIYRPSFIENMPENERFGLVFAKTGSIISETVINSSNSRSSLIQPALIWEVQEQSVRYSSSILFDSCVKCKKTHRWLLLPGPGVGGNSRETH